ncbi:MAG TPA: macro domain-containing protein [Candidatus Thiothrix moscowensis]|uniref:type II toxin-antitoxin system antitoxin DNA ADP-ribosyl glycohydrolase DarG n=1 Tax=unclassified Thiothrix TaxID=2636184 RepID=UPI0025EEAB17|nr:MULTISPECIES: macro domain-containing protein [unclassified Thiothrix]HRJ52697.1 macro domain-containing protein [Candidatus Thiothrix moscowensis]HRJ92819.1 macro domain-containing protein [Candidatus Thiothrix moscowensis]
MIHYTQGNLLDAPAQALVNTVNTMGVMGKGIALMFKERFDKNRIEYEKACKNHQVQTGKMFVTETGELMGPRWIINFPTKRHWRHPSRMEWIVEGLQDLRHFILENQVQSIAIPPLGAGNGGLDWTAVREKIEHVLGNLPQVDIQVYEPIQKYQNVAKRKGVEKLTPARALIAELVRRYWIMGMECTLLEIQKLAWFLEQAIEHFTPGDNPLDLRFKPDIYGPYADRLRHLLDGLDGSYLHCDKRISDASPLDVIWFDDTRKNHLQAYLQSDAVKPYLPALEHTAKVIDGFESPFGLELLSTLGWLLVREQVSADTASIQQGLREWPAGRGSGERKARLFDQRVIGIALKRLESVKLAA